MEVTVKTEINSSAELVWKALEQVERYPEWHEAMAKVESLGSGPLQVGAKYRVHQPGLAAQVWAVTQVEREKNFAWKVKKPGLLIVANHQILPSHDQGKVSVVLSIRMQGFVGVLLGLMLKCKIKQNIAVEAECLKRRCEKQ